MRGECGEMIWSGHRGSVWIGRGGGPSTVAAPLEDAPGGSKASDLLINID